VIYVIFCDLCVIDVIYLFNTRIQESRGTHEEIFKTSEFDQNFQGK